jgi:hypothetical protein
MVLAYLIAGRWQSMVQLSIQFTIFAFDNNTTSLLYSESCFSLTYKGKKQLANSLFNFNFNYLLTIYCREKMAEFYCAHCKIQMNSTSQWDAHVIGGKHMRAVTMNQPLAVDMSAASINSICIVCFDTSIQYVHFFYIVVLPNGNFKCKSCDDFECSGHIPFEQHLTGKKHLKNVQRGKESTQFNTAVKSPLYGQRQPTTLVHSPPAMKSGSLPIALATVSSACKVLFTPHKSPEKIALF